MSLKLSDSMKNYFSSFREPLLPLYEELHRQGELEAFTDKLRHDLFLTMVLLGKAENAGEMELVSFICLDWSLIQSSDFVQEYQNRSAVDQHLADHFLKEEKENYLSKLQSFTGKEAYKLGKFLSFIDPRNALHQYISDLCFKLHRYFTIMLKIDGVITAQETAGFEQFWNEYRKLAERPFTETSKAEAKQMESASSTEEIKLVKLSDEDPLEELNSLIGLENIKGELRSFRRFLEVQQMRKSRGMPQYRISLHAVFSGSPGTGKTTVARIYAKVLRELGYLSKGHLVEVDRAGLVAGYMGQTAEKTEKVIDRALGGVLFIDEAYSITQRSDGNDYGLEVIEVLLNRMEKFRDDLVVIVAGYEEEMAAFLDSNPGLCSRFNKRFTFSDFSAAELLEIFQKFCRTNQYELKMEANRLLSSKLEEIWEKRDRNFGNARFVRNLFEKVLERQCDRLSGMSSLSNYDLMLLDEGDVAAALGCFDESGKVRKMGAENAVTAF